MLDPDELERRFRARPAIDDGTIHVIVVRKDGGVHDLPARATLDPVRGVVGDRWSASPRPDPEAQVTLMERRVASLLLGDDPARLHVPGDNLIVDLDLSVAALPAGTRLRLGSARIEITPAPHTGCAKFRARVGADGLRWVNAHAHRDRRLRGVNARVVEGGEVAIGDRATRV